MKCPKGSIVGGVDARLTSRAIDMSFSGRLGSPVNPGVTTTSEVVFTGTYSGQQVTTGRVQAVRRLHPDRWRGPRTDGHRRAGGVQAHLAHPAARAHGVVHPPHRARNEPLSRGERLVSFTHAVAFSSPKEPTARQLAGVRSSLVRRGRSPRGRRRRSAAPPRSLKAKLQILAVCTRGAVQP